MALSYNNLNTFQWNLLMCNVMHCLTSCVRAAVLMADRIWQNALVSLESCLLFCLVQTIVLMNLAWINVHKLYIPHSWLLFLFVIIAFSTKKSLQSLYQQSVHVHWEILYVLVCSKYTQDQMSQYHFSSGQFNVHHNKNTFFSNVFAQNKYWHLNNAILTSPPFQRHNQKL